VSHYIYRAQWSTEDGEYVGQCVEFPSLSWLAPTAHEAIAGVEQVVADAVADMAANGEQLPTPLAERAYSGQVYVRTSPEVHARLVIEAAEQGISLNQLAVQRLVRSA
jgi:predicted HicB family RNase H-like nuclease